MHALIHPLGILTTAAELPLGALLAIHAIDLPAPLHVCIRIDFLSRVKEGSIEENTWGSLHHPYLGVVDRLWPQTG